MALKSNPSKERPTSHGIKRAWYEDDEETETRSDESYHSTDCPKCGAKCIECRAKRQRTSGPLVPDTSLKPMDEYKKSEFYRTDGDIVLIVEDTLIRAHRLRLMKYQGLLQDLFSLPQPPDAEKIDGVPFCHIPNVSYEDLLYAVKYVYGEVRNCEYIEDLGVDVNYPGSVSLIRVGTRLDTGYLRTAGIEGLCRMFPPKYYAPDTKPPDDEDNYFTAPFIGVQVVNLAREYDIPLLLPKAFYRCAQLTISELVNGVPNDKDEMERLSEQDLVMALQGRERLIFARRHTVLSLINSFTHDAHPVSPCRGCSNTPQKGGETCFHWFMRMHIDFNRSRLPEMNTRALEMIPRVAMDKMKEHLCAACGEMFELRMDAGYAAVHDDLPRYFNLPLWRELHEKQLEADSKWDEQGGESEEERAEEEGEVEQDL